MEPVSNENASSRCAALRNLCLCETAKEGAQYAALMGAFVASLLWIPIPSLQGAGVGASLFLLGNKTISKAHAEMQTLHPIPPRTWTQIGVGLGVSSGMMACAFIIHSTLWAPVLAPAGLVLGLAITHSESLWQCCSMLRDCCFLGRYRRITPIPQVVAFPVEQSATSV